MNKLWALPALTLAGCLTTVPLASTAFGDNSNYTSTPAQGITPPCSGAMSGASASGNASTCTKVAGSSTAAPAKTAPAKVSASGVAPAVSAAPAGTAARPATGGLAFTGAEIGSLSGLAVAAVGIGGVMVVAGRRRRTT